MPLSSRPVRSTGTPSPVRSIARRAVCLPAATVLLLTVAACGSDASTSASPSTSSSSSAPTSASAGASPSTSASASAPTSSGSQATPAIVAAANAFLATLSAQEKSTGLFAGDDTTQKRKWSNLPTGLYERSGLAIGDLSQDQVDAFLAVMKATLSSEGYNRVMAEWAADDALAASSGGGGPQLNFGKKYYYIAIIGEPSATESWQWQFGGHHVTVNATIHGGDLSLTPSFIGAQPATYTAGGADVRPLGDIEDDAYALIGSLDDTEKSKAVLGSDYIDLVLGPGKDCMTTQSEGLAGSAMTADQQAALLTLVNDYGGLANDEDAKAREAQLKTDLPQTSFAWYGPTTAGSAAYFRVTGPHVVIEYSPQSMGGDATEHIHGIYRDPTNDYGGTVCS